MNDNKLTKSDMYGVIWRSFNFAGNYNFERMMAVGMTDMLIPVIRKLYDTKEEISQALKRHLVFYNCHPYLGAMITGIMVAMEEKKGKWRTNRGFYHQWSENSNDGTVCWCGRFFFSGGTIHPIFLSLSAALAAEGNMSGFFIALLFFLPLFQ